MPDLDYKRILVAIETDATRYHGEHASRPRELDQGEAEQMLAHLSTDLASQYSEIKSCALCMTGALFDQTQMLRPAYPLYSKMESILEASYAGQPFQPRLISIGAESGVMPEDDLQPQRDIPLGLLQTLPLVVGGEPDLIAELAETMEHRFLERGQLSAHSAKALEAHFGVSVNHARFMTVTDLNAMLRLQLEHFGFLPLWELLDAAINMPETALATEGKAGQAFSWNGQAVRCTFETFDFWANEGNGKSHAAEGQMLAQAYAEWTREYRQYLTTLGGHKIPVEQVLPDRPDVVLGSTFLVEESSLAPGKDVSQVTEHSAGELGTVAVTVARDGGLFNYYPLSPTGLNDLHASIRDTCGGTAAVVSFPGSILYDDRSRRLRPDAA